MAEGKKTFIFYSDWTNMIKEMPDSDAGQLLKHILSYVNDEDPTSDNLLVKMAFGHMKPMLKADLDKWEKQLEKYSEMGKKSAKTRAKNKVEPRLTQVEPTSTVNVNDNVNVNVNDNKEFEPKKAPSLVTVLRGVFEEEYFDKTGIEFYWNASEASSCKSLIQKFKKTYSDQNFEFNEEGAKTSLIKMMNIDDPWIQSNLSMKILNSKFNEIINALKNGKGKQTTEKRQSEIMSAIHKEFNPESTI